MGGETLIYKKYVYLCSPIITGGMLRAPKCGVLIVVLLARPNG